MPPALTVPDKIEIVLIHGDNYKTSRQTADIFNTRHPEKMIHYSTVSRLIQKFKRTGNVENDYKHPHEKTVTGDEGTLDVLLTVLETPQVSISDVSATTTIKATSVQRILKRNKFHPYKPRFVHVLKDRDYDARMDFCAWFQGMIEDNPSFSKKIMFTDEATFSSNGVVSSQNCRWWATDNPKFIIESKDQYSFKVNVWCGIYNCSIIGPFFFYENLNSERYLNFLQAEISNVLDNIPLQQRAELYFQQDGASIHSTRNVRRWLDETFYRRWIGRFSENPWPARSPDLTPLDFFLWGYLKHKVYKHRPFRDLGHLEHTIRNCAAEITPQMVRNVHREMQRRTILCMERDGGHVEFN